MSEPPWVPGPGQKPPPLPEFQPEPKTKVFIPWKFKLYFVFGLIIVLYLVVGLLAHS